MKRTNDPLATYASKFKGLTKEEEKGYFATFSKDHDEKTRYIIYNHNLRIIYILLTQKHLYSMDHDDLDDLIMLLAYHLWELIPKFDIERGYRFSTFAQFCLYNRAKSYLKKIGKHNERFMPIAPELEENETQEDGRDVEKEAIVEEYGKENNIPSEIIENALLLLEADQDQNPVEINSGYGGRFAMYGDEMDFMFSKNSV